MADCFHNYDYNNVYRQAYRRRMEDYWEDTRDRGRGERVTYRLGRHTVGWVG